jgi:predicted  nucleic acid-binding Zn-ribbon protein
MTERGPNDLEQQIDVLKAEKVALYADVKKYRDENEALKKQKIYLQKQCRKAGVAILGQETINKGLIKDIDRLSEENANLLTMYNGKG